MSLDTFYFYQLAWYVFGTFAAFAAAWFFWNKGITEVDGGALHMMRGMRLTGAGGLFVAVLLVVHMINPLKPLSDYDRLLLLYSDAAAESPQPEGSEDFTIAVTEHADLGLGSEVAVELVRFKDIHSLAPELGQGAFMTREPIPPGTYRVRIVHNDTGETKEFMVRVPQLGT